MVQHLFTGTSLRDVLTNAAERASSTLATWPADDLLTTPQADIVDQLVGLATVEVPALERDKAHLEPPAEVKVDTVDFGRRLKMTVTRFTLVVPVAGDPSLFGMTASTYSGGSLIGEIDRKRRSLRLHCDNPRDSGSAKAYFEQTLNQIEQRLQRTRADIQAHNQQVATQIASAVAQRRAKLLSDRDLQASIGYPIKKRPDADSYAVPIGSGGDRSPRADHHAHRERRTRSPLSRLSRRRTTRRCWRFSGAHATS